MKTRIYIIILSIFISNVSCNEPEENIEPEVIIEQTDIHTLFISSNLKKHFYNVNTTWIYESNNGEIDSVSLHRKEREILDPVSMHGQVVVGYVENYKFHYLSTKDGSYWDQYIGYVIVRNGIELAQGEYIYLSNYKIGASSNEAKIDTIYDSYNVLNNTYRNVVKMRIINFEFESGENWYYYFADSVGVIKKEKINDGLNTEIWNLIDRNI